MKRNTQIGERLKRDERINTLKGVLIPLIPFLQREKMRSTNGIYICYSRFWWLYKAVEKRDERELHDRELQGALIALKRGKKTDRRIALFLIKITKNHMKNTHQFIVTEWGKYDYGERDFRKTATELTCQRCLLITERTPGDINFEDSLSFDCEE